VFYQYIENLGSLGEVALILFILYAGSFINVVFTDRIFVFFGFVGGFFLQALVRAFVQDISFLANLVPMTGTAFILFSFYMITDPATSPLKRSNQLLFGLCTAAVYGILQYYNVVYGIFYALTIVCALRGLWWYLLSWTEASQLRPVQA